MKSIILILIGFISSISLAQEAKSKSLSDSQSNAETSNRSEVVNPVIPPASVANIYKEINQSNVQYSFVSNKPFSEFKEDPWESRFMTAFPYLIGIEIKAVDQMIVIVLPGDHTEEELFNVVKRFNYNGFQVLN